MEKYAKYGVEDFATDVTFINWIQHPNSESIKFWNEVAQKYPGQKEKIEEATVIVQSLTLNESSIPEEKIISLWRNIDNGKNKRLEIKYLRWAAIAVLLIGISTVIVQYLNVPEFKIAEIELENVNDAHVIFSDGSIKSIDNNDSEIQVGVNGEIVIENDTVVQENSIRKDIELTHVVMPYGKQTQLQLPDGSIVYVNSGSKLSFPIRFTGNKREIYLIGEAYLKVKSNLEKPFIVQTPEMEVVVSGTEFNVSAYADDDFSQTVLVQGAVSVRKKGLLNRKIEVKPGESAFIDKKSGDINKQLVDVEQYTSWINGYFRCENESLQSIVKKLERYYNCNITIEHDVSVSFSGKLDLKNNVENVLETITFASSLKMEQDERAFLIKR